MVIDALESITRAGVVQTDAKIYLAVSSKNMFCLVEHIHFLLFPSETFTNTATSCDTRIESSSIQLGGKFHLRNLIDYDCRGEYRSESTPSDVTVFNVIRSVSHNQQHELSSKTNKRVALGRKKLQSKMDIILTTIVDVMFPCSTLINEVHQVEHFWNGFDVALYLFVVLAQASIRMQGVVTVGGCVVENELHADICRIIACSAALFSTSSSSNLSASTEQDLSVAKVQVVTLLSTKDILEKQIIFGSVSQFLPELMYASQVLCKQEKRSQHDNISNPDVLRPINQVVTVDFVIRCSMQVLAMSTADYLVSARRLIASQTVWGVRRQMRVTVVGVVSSCVILVKEYSSLSTAVFRIQLAGMTANDTIQSFVKELVLDKSEGSFLVLFLGHDCFAGRLQNGNHLGILIDTTRDPRILETPVTNISLLELQTFFYAASIPALLAKDSRIGPNSLQWTDQYFPIDYYRTLRVLKLAFYNREHIAEQMDWNVPLRDQINDWKTVYSFVQFSDDTTSFEIDDEESSLVPREEGRSKRARIIRADGADPFQTSPIETSRK